MTVTMGWEWLAGLLVWSAVVFRIGMGFGAGGRSHLEGGTAMPPPVHRSPPLPTSPALGAAVPRGPADVAPHQLAEITEQIRLGNKIHAIKLLRDATGMGLAEAKYAVEAMMD